MPDPLRYTDREQTYVKHFVLKHYLERFAHIIGFKWDSITYVDCFAGPWKSQDESLEDTSFAIAIQELARARKDLKESTGREVRVRCFFIEPDKSAFIALQEFAEKQRQEFEFLEIQTKNATLADSIDDILQFVNSDKNTFPFFFIDPTGWTGFEMEIIKPLMGLKHCEMLINFMTSYVLRFVKHPEEAQAHSFEGLFGSPEFLQQIQAISSNQDRDDAVADYYCSQLELYGCFHHVARALVLNPGIDKRHFDLVYATRNIRGLEVFKSVERKAMSEMETVRQKIRDAKGGVDAQDLLFEMDQFGKQETYYERLRESFLKKAYEDGDKLLTQMPTISYDVIWSSMVKFPLVWDADIKAYIRDKKAQGKIVLTGIADSERVPKLRKGVMIERLLQ